jgi:hypothetical protein
VPYLKQAAPRPFGQVQAFSGKDGRLLWTWRGPAGHTFAEQANPDDLLLKLPGGRRGVGVLVQKTNFGKFDVQLLDDKGKVCQSSPITMGSPYSVATRIRRYDVDGEAALLLLSNGELRATRGVEKLLWRWPVPDIEATGIVAVQPGAGRAPPLVVVRADSVVYGLDGRTGKEVWRCEGGSGNVYFLPSTDPKQPPRVVFRIGFHSVARQVVPRP